VLPAGRRRLVDLQGELDRLIDAADPAAAYQQQRDLRVVVAVFRVAQLEQPLVPVPSTLEGAVGRGT
jgi:hypothetical protein